jgi:hypothetical protein
MDAMVFEWCFDCDQASEAANDLFDTVMDRRWLLEHGIHPFDTDAAWEEVMKQLSHLREPCLLTIIRVAEPNPAWDSFQANLMKGSDEK